MLPIHPEKVTAWRDLWAGGIIGPYSCKDAANRNVMRMVITELLCVLKAFIFLKAYVDVHIFLLSFNVFLERSFSLVYQKSCDLLYINNSVINTSLL